MESLTPKDAAEAVALYRAQVVGPLVRRCLEHGELASALAELSTQRFQSPRSHGGRAYSVATLERWYCASKRADSTRFVPKRAAIEVADAS